MATPALTAANQSRLDAVAEESTQQGREEDVFRVSCYAVDVVPGGLCCRPLSGCWLMLRNGAGSVAGPAAVGCSKAPIMCSLIR